MDLISREQAISKLEDLIIARRGWLSDGSAEIRGIDAAIGELVALSSAEKTGKWTISTESRFRPFMCSACGCIYDVDTNIIGEPIWNYCPNCGARMGQIQ